MLSPAQLSVCALGFFFRLSSRGSFSTASLQLLERGGGVVGRREAGRARKRLPLSSSLLPPFLLHGPLSCAYIPGLRDVYLSPLLRREEPTLEGKSLSPPDAPGPRARFNSPPVQTVWASVDFSPHVHCDQRHARFKAGPSAERRRKRELSPALL